MVVTGALILLGGIRLINNNFDFNSIKVEAWDVVLLIFIGIASASGLKKIRIEITEINDKLGLIKWVDDYFSEHNGSKIYQSDQYLVYKTEKPKKLIKLRKTPDYYLTTFKGDSVIIEGPFSNLPKFVNE